MLIDVHSHILPGIDDGAGDIMESRKMLDIAVGEKIDAIITTPHFECGMMDQAVIDVYKRQIVKQQTLCSTWQVSTVRKIWKIL